MEGEKLIFHCAPNPPVRERISHASLAHMPYLKQLELENFKSYAGRTVIGPLDPSIAFTSVIGPNGSGKSNLMDAICFVLGLQAASMRSSALHELIYRTKVVDPEGDDSENKNMNGHGHDNRDMGDAKNGRRGWGASVTAVYVDQEGVEHRLERAINAAGTSSEYRLDGQPVSYGAYCEYLASQNLLVKARNFLVFQGDVEAVATKSPRDLLKLFEQLTGADDLREEYAQAKAEHDRALELSAFAFNKKRALTQELKVVHEQRDAVAAHERLMEQRAQLLSEQCLCQLFNLEQAATAVGREIDDLERQLQGTIREATNHEHQVADERKQVASLQKELKDAKWKLAKLPASASAAAATSAQLLQAKLAELEQRSLKLQEERVEKATQLESLERELDSLREPLGQSNANDDIEGEDAMNREDYEAKKQTYLGGTVKERLKLEALERQRAPFLFEIKLAEEKLRELDVRQTQCQHELQHITAALSKATDLGVRLQEQLRQANVHNVHRSTEQKRLQYYSHGIFNGTTMM
jgi:structural maintenance of chromosome 1